MEKEKLVEIEVELENDVILELALMAHERDITLNQLMVECLTEHINELEKEKKE